MKSESLQQRWRRVSARAVIVTAIGCALSACGGGKSDDGNLIDDSSQVPKGSGKVTLTGVVSKGRMAGAQVLAHPVKNGEVDVATVLASGTTRTDGRYELPAFEVTPGTPVVVQVSVVDGTVHTDEVSGTSVPLPSTFTMRSAVVPQTTDVTLPVNITPFSEMVVRAAETGPDKLGKASVQQGKSAVTQLLGFDPLSTDVNGISPSNSAAVNAQGLMLAAVSQLAMGPEGDALGCTMTDAGAAIACTVDKLAQAAKLDSIQLSIGEIDVGAGLSRALVDVSTNEALVPDGVDVTVTVDRVTARLACEPGSLTNPCEVAQVDQQATGVAATKAMFMALRTAADGWFSRGGLAGGGRLNRDAQAYEAAVTQARQPLDQVTQDLAVMQLGIELYRDFMSGRTTSNGRSARFGRAEGYDRTLLADGNQVSHGGTWSEAAIGCTLRTADGSVATTPAQVVDIGCRSSVRMEIERVAPSGTQAGTIRITDWRHGVTLEPKGTSGADAREFAYTTSASRRVRTRTCTGSVFPGGMSGCSALTESASERVDLQQTSTGDRRIFSGTFVAAPRDGSSAAFEVMGELPGLLDRGDGSLVNDRQAVNLVITDTGAVDGVATLAGKVEAFDSASATAASGTLEIATGSRFTFVAANEDGSRPAAGASTVFREPASARIGLTWRTTGAALRGTLDTSDIVWDRSGRERSPSRLTFAGQLDFLSGGTARNWITAELSMTQTGWEAHDPTLPIDASNPDYTVAGTFSGTVTPTDGKPPFYLSLTTAKKSNEPYPTALSGTLRMGSGSAPRVNIQLSATNDAAGFKTWTLHETLQDLTITVNRDTRSSPIRQGSGQLLVGTIDHDQRRVNYADLTFESLDLGL